MIMHLTFLSMDWINTITSTFGRRVHNSMENSEYTILNLEAAPALIFHLFT